MLYGSNLAQHTINTDVLVIGGGLAGCWAAIRAKAFVPSVTLVDKTIISRSGASAWAYYILAPTPVSEREKADWSLMAQALARETFGGKGPVVLDLSEAREEDIDYFARLHPGRMAPLK